jgi:integrase
VKRGLLRSNPCDSLRNVRSRKARVNMQSKEEVRLLLARLSPPTPPEGSMGWCLSRTALERRAGRPPQVDPRWRLIVETSAFTGLRAGELAGLKVEDFDPQRRSLSVVRNIPANGLTEETPKSSAGLRVVRDLRPSLCLRLEALTADARPSDYLFGWKDAYGVSHPYRHMNFYRRVFRPACDELGIGGRFHDLHHFHASLLIEQGLDPVQVAARLGHRSRRPLWMSTHTCSRTSRRGLALRSTVTGWTTR